jgi:hypothetical protein
VKAHSALSRAGILNTMKAEAVTHVCNFTWVVGRPSSDVKSSGFEATSALPLAFIPLRECCCVCTYSKEQVCSVLGHLEAGEAGHAPASLDCWHGQEYSVSVTAPFKILITQCALAWSWIGDAFPGLHTRMSCYALVVNLSHEALRQCLSGRSLTYQVTLPVAVVHKVPGVSSRVIRKGVASPLALARTILGHDVLKFLHIDTSAVDAIARA